MTQFKKVLLVMICLGGTVVLPVHADNSQHHGDRLSSWCGDTLATLDRARRDADMHYYRGDFSRAYQALMEGLSSTQAQNPFGNQGPLTAKAVDRGLALGDAIARASAGHSNAMRTTVFFLFNYYDFIHRVAKDIDYPFYIPYQNCGGCRTVEEAVFERRFVEYAKEQVEMVLKTLADTGNGRGLVYPVGATEGFLKALELSARFAAGDLRESLWAARYACAVVELEDLARKLAFGGFINEVDAVNGSYQLARDVLARLDRGHSRCN